MLSENKYFLSPNFVSNTCQEQKFLSKFLQETLAMTKRLFIQLWRRPSTLIAGIVQPFMWLILFGALFHNAPEGIFESNINYAKFLSPGIIVFTAFSGSLNAGLPIMFDREFGFLNRLLVAPLSSRYSIVASSTLYIVSLSLLQTGVIIIASSMLGAGIPNIYNLAAIILVVLLTVCGVTGMSLGLAFALPGHIELIAVIFVTNLPLLFASTALAPLSFMSRWLQVIASLNPLTYAIEFIRYIFVYGNLSMNDIVFKAPFIELTGIKILLLLLGFDMLVLLSIQPLLRRKFN